MNLEAPMVTRGWMGRFLSGGLTGLVMLACTAAWSVEPNGFAPSPGALWHNAFCARGTETVLVGDFNGDHRDDLVAFDGDRVLLLYAATDGRRFDGPLDGPPFPLPAGAVPLAGDVDGNNYCDLVYFVRPDPSTGERGGVYAIFNSRDGFERPDRLSSHILNANDIPALGDVNGDRKRDLIVFTQGGDGAVRVGISAGRRSIGELSIWANGFLGANQIPCVGRFDDDATADIALFVRNADPLTANQVQVSLSSGTSFGAKQKWNDFFCTGAERPFTGDVDGDGRADIITFVRGCPGASGAAADTDPAGDVYVALSQRIGDRFRFGPGIRRHSFFSINDELPLVGDFNGDQKADLCTLVRGSSTGGGAGSVYVACSTFYRTSSWRARVESIKVARADESSGDDPRVILLGFRARPHSQETIHTWVSRFDGAWPQDLATGEGVRLPAGTGELSIPCVRALTRSDLLRGELPEVVGFVIMAVEADNTSDVDVAAQAAQAQERMKQYIGEYTRNLRITAEDPSTGIREFTQAVARGANAGAMSAYRRLSHGINDEDDMVEAQIFYYPAVDPEVLPWLELPAGFDFGTRTLTEQYWRLSQRPLVFTGGGQSHWQLQFRLQRTDDPLAPRGSLADDMELRAVDR